ncbi:hypothetical protein XAP412_810002 [Xanthomonas phaseoli pv. phaseoli]|uniref:Uncharacterized protein n=1 Tax=Xanthomonas campestris pv. phaseoli TaxID=317013 RepID=A0AB38E5C7_XANCH|nr:hypothetical protein XAP6984_250010 [Xanthomonas phaseoli pv. phaseoli]SON90817.1 hypothetical protein XAP412_810002 [Xanthomonas phaseoli pv. phaseoli]SON92669.1 hypothetical protein XAP7430_810002 [Xanthomonas phaseoli pv. phaseoli]
MTHRAQRAVQCVLKKSTSSTSLAKLRLNSCGESLQSALVYLRAIQHVACSLCACKTSEACANNEEKG